MEINDKLILAIFLLSCLDAIFTITWVELNIGEELNPLLLYFIDIGPVHFMVIKLCLTAAGCVVFQLTKKHPFCKKAIQYTLLLYILVNIYHLLGVYFTFSN